MQNIKWLFCLKNNIPLFLEKLKGKKRAGFYHYSLSGDYFGENIKWGLGNSVFFLKTAYTLGLENEYQREIKDAINFIKSFQKKDGIFFNPWINILSIPLRIRHTFKTKDFNNILNKQTKKAETRQSFSALYLFNEKPNYEYKDIPSSKQEVNEYLSKLNWKLPWGAGSHFSHLLFFLQHSNLINKQELIQYAIDWINKIQRKNDGFWHQENPSLQQKINGAMKIITGLKAVSKVHFKYPEKIIENILSTENGEHACDNFNIVYTLKYCNELTDGDYRFKDIENFMYQKLIEYKKYYYPKLGGFSFYKNRANRIYYGALIGKGKNEPDIHGTVMFLWGISLIAQVLGINNRLKFKEFIA